MNSTPTTEKFNWLKGVGFEIKATIDSTGTEATLGDMIIVFYPTHFLVNDRYSISNWRELLLTPFQFIIKGYMQQILSNKYNELT